MTRYKKSARFSKPVIDLTGPQGNAFFLMGAAANAARQLHLDGDAILADMQSGDYEHLLEVFENYFGDYYDLVE